MEFLALHTTCLDLQFVTRNLRSASLFHIYYPKHMHLHLKTSTSYLIYITFKEDANDGYWEADTAGENNNLPLLSH